MRWFVLSTLRCILAGGSCSLVILAGLSLPSCLSAANVLANVSYITEDTSPVRKCNNFPVWVSMLSAPPGYNLERSWLLCHRVYKNGELEATFFGMAHTRAHSYPSDA
jgi:hypothetical protein